MNDYPPDWPEIADRVKAETGNRCIRCGHRDEPPWKSSPAVGLIAVGCDDQCEASYHREAEAHMRVMLVMLNNPLEVDTAWRLVPQRVLTVHHLDGDKSNCEWWNLAALCQVCHLIIQGKVRMEQVWMLEHSEWFKPYVAGYMAHIHLGIVAARDKEMVLSNLEELLALEA